jgi:plastocyanin
MSYTIKLKEMKKVLFSILLFLSGTAGFCTTWTITNNLDTFVPATVTIAPGDSVNFVIGITHQPREVSQATYNAGGNTLLPGGFETPFGGGLVLPAQLGVGTHYYVCSVHYLFGMKGTIIVQSNAAIAVNHLSPDFSVYPNPVSTSMTINARNDWVGSQYIITDQAGRQILEGKLVDEATPVDISRLTPGVYIIQMAGQRRSAIKMIKN